MKFLAVVSTAVAAFAASAAAADPLPSPPIAWLEFYQTDLWYPLDFPGINGECEYVGVSDTKNVTISAEDGASPSCVIFSEVDCSGSNKTFTPGEYTFSHHFSSGSFKCYNN